MVRPVRKFLGPYTKDEHLKFLTLQNGKRQNRVFASLGSDIPVRVHPEIVPKLKKKKSVKPSSSDDDDDVEVEDIDEEIGEENAEEEEGEEGADEEENDSGDDSDSSSSSSDNSSDSSESDDSKTVPPLTVLADLKRKKTASSPPPEPSSKRVQLVIDSDEELDEDDIRIDLSAIHVTPIRADASFALSAKEVASLYVVAPATTVVEEDCSTQVGDAIETTNPLRADLDLVAKKAKTSVNAAEKSEAGKSAADGGVRTTGSSNPTPPPSPPFIATPSPELIQNVLGGFSERCAKDGHWLMGLPNFNELGESSHHGPNLCLNDLKYRHPLSSIGDELEKVLITPDLEKEFLEENDLMSSWTALDVSAAQVFLFIYLFIYLFIIIFFLT